MSELRAVLRDPFCAYEYRRYWTWQRYTLGSVARVAWWTLLVVGIRLGIPEFGGSIDAGRMIVLLVLLALAGRIPLSFMASTGAATCIVPEKVSGQLEQFVLTAVDPWRFCLARLVGRLKGLLAGWFTVGGFLVLACMLGNTTATYGPADWLQFLLVILVAQLDLAVFLVVDAAVGMRFTSMCRSTAAALTKTYLANFLLAPLSMQFGPMTCGFMALAVMERVGGRFGGPQLRHVYMAIACGLAPRLLLGALAVWMSLRDARKAIHKTFYEPEDHL